MFCVISLVFPVTFHLANLITTRFTEYQADIVKRKKEQFSKIAVFPCKLKMLPDHIYTRRDPIVAGVKVEVDSHQCEKIRHYSMGLWLSKTVNTIFKLFRLE